MLDLLKDAIGETIDAVRARGDGQWAIVTRSLIIYARAIQWTDRRPLEGRTISAIEAGAIQGTWILFLEDDAVATLGSVDAVKRGLTPVEGIPIVLPSNKQEN